MRISISTGEISKVSKYMYMQFMEPLGTADSSVDAAWDYLRGCWRPEVVELTKRLAPGMLRFGGCFASYYHWREAVGPMSERRAMYNLCWDGMYPNHVGTAEFIDLCRQTGAEPLPVVNMESDGRMHWAYPLPGEDRFGTAEEAAAWVSYCNDPDNEMRVRHGAEKPYGVKWWQIGNETSYDALGYGLEQAAQATGRFARAMRAADPSVKLIGWGDDGKSENGSGWAARMAEEDVDLIAFHHHFDSGLPDSPLYGTEYRRDPQKTWDHLMHAHVSLREHIEALRGQMRASGKKLAMTEGHFALPGRNRCEVLSSWMAGVSYARCLNEQLRASDILEIATMADFCGNRWQVNAMMIPTPFTGAEKPYLQPVGQVMRLFGTHTGESLCSVEECGDLDVTATRTADTLYLHIVNTSLSETKRAEIFADGRAAKEMRVHMISTSDPTEEITGLCPDLFEPRSYTAEGGVLLLPPACVCAVEIPLDPQGT